MAKGKLTSRITRGGRTYEIKLSKKLCLSCLSCCKGLGWVYITLEDRSNIARELRMTPEQFVRQYCIEKDGWTFLKSQENDDCVFLNRQRGCVVYSMRPKQCRDFPYKWRYENITEECPGVIDVTDK